jgi:hypothetical protein
MQIPTVQSERVALADVLVETVTGVRRKFVAVAVDYTQTTVMRPRRPSNSDAAPSNRRVGRLMTGRVGGRLHEPFVTNLQLVKCGVQRVPAFPSFVVEPALISGVEIGDLVSHFGNTVIHRDHS